MSDWSYRSAAGTRLARFFQSPIRFAAATVGVLGLGAGATLSGLPGGLLTMLGATALLATVASPVQFLWERALTDMAEREGQGGNLDPATRMRRLEEAVNLVASWCGRLEREAETGLGAAVKSLSAQMNDLADRLKALDRRDGDRAETIDTLYEAIHSTIARQSELARRLAEAEKREFAEGRKLVMRLSVEARKVENRVAAVEVSQKRGYRNHNAIQAQLADLTEALRVIRADLDAGLGQSAETDGSDATLSLLEQRVAALATNFERAALSRGDRIRLDG